MIEGLKKEKTDRIILIAILAVAALFRISLAVSCDSVPDYSDMATYNEAAMSGGIPSFPPPGYPLFLRAIYTVFGDYNYKAVFVIQGLLSLMTVFMIYSITVRVSNRTAGLAAAGIAAIYPNLLAYNLTTLTESLSVFLVVLILYLMTSRSREAISSILAGVFLSAAYFVKPSILFFTPGIILGVKKRMTFLITLAAILGPVFIYGSLSGTGEGRGPVLLYKAYNPRAAETPVFSMEETELGDEGTSGEEYLEETINFISGNKWKTLDIIYYKSSLLISRGWDSFVLKDISRNNRHLTNILIYGYIPVMLLGFAGLIRFIDRDNRVVAWMMISYLVIHIIITIFKLRYRLLIEPMMIIYSGITISRMIGRFDSVEYLSGESVLDTEASPRI
ncbi:MAG: glycosyltransferase family 39 protein [Candidatus Krumholzibacteriota bacterium]|nr:glycosyltransferase family 39 protein [Candidatus Krumholzibacteriota bacterium]